MSDHTTITPITKVCKKCGQEKPRSEYYKRKQNRDGLYTACKACCREISRNQRFKSRFEAGYESEDIAITKLRDVGIYAANGKCSEWKKIDVVAWGCVRVEVKHSVYEPEWRRFRFNLGAKSKRRWFDCDLVLLICEWPDKPRTFHLFPSNHPIFFYKGDKLKTSIAWIADPVASLRPRFGGEPITGELMSQHQDAWHLIERARLSRIKAIQAVPQERAA